jgi:tRNA A-37 threonylcarbamoyl transferase component Bud32
VAAGRSTLSALLPPSAQRGHTEAMSDSALSQSSSGLDLDLSGRQLGDYRLLRRLGRGAMAEVYLAEQGSLRRQVAFKVLKRELANDATYVRRFHLEAQAAAALLHANIVQIYQVGCIDGVHFISQEYVAGSNLRELLLRRGLPKIPMVVSVMRQVAAALAKAAEQGIVHRDIKPENIIVTAGGEVKVADFGLARISGEGDSLNLTQTGMTMGTPLYMSPEQVEGRPLDARSDIYSLGVTCYHMLCGQPPFRGETALSVAVQHLKSLPERLENRRPDLPPALGRIVHKMLAKDPKDRYTLLKAPASETASATIDRKPSSMEQYLYAVQLGTEAGWKSVAAYFPNDKVYVPRAQQQLARYYLQQDRYDEALALFKDFANYDAVESKYKAFGLAGECVVYSLKGNQQGSAAEGLKLSTLAGGLTPDKLDKLLDRQMVELVGHVLRKDPTLNNKQTAAEWSKWQDEHFHDEAQ